jgi:hypothetical protein
MVVPSVVKLGEDSWNGGARSTVPVGCGLLLSGKVYTHDICCIRLLTNGIESLDELTEMVVPLFALVKNRGRDPSPMITEHPFGPNESGVSANRAVWMIYRLHRV